MINKFDTALGTKLDTLNFGDDCYFKAEKLHISITENAIFITDISNALGWGKHCLRNTISLTEGGIITSSIIKKIQLILDDFKLDLKDLLIIDTLNTIKNELDAEYDIQIEISEYQTKGVNTYSPFIEINKKRAIFPNEIFGRWQLIKFLLSKKIEATDEMIKAIVETPAQKQTTKLEARSGNYAIISFKSKGIFYELETVTDTSLTSVA